MAKAGDKLYSPVLGDWLVFGQTAEDTSGELMSGELVVPPSVGNPLHVHPLQEEHFEVLSGTFGVQIGDKRRSLGEGEEATVPPGTPHRWFNEDDQQEVRVSVELRPALNSETFFETAYGLARNGKTDENGVPNLLQPAVTLNGINKGEIYLASPPVAVQKVFLAALAPVGRLLGYKDHYPKYSAADGLGGDGPPSTASVLTRAAALVGGLVASSFLIGKTRHRSKG